MTALRQFVRSSRLGRWALGVSAALVFVALFAPWLAPYDPAVQNLPARLEPPSAEHWFGTDELGRDVLTRVIFGARVSITVGVSVVLSCAALGLLVGSVSGYFGGWFDRATNAIFINAFLSFPGILLAIAFAAFLGPDRKSVV